MATPSQERGHKAATDVTVAPLQERSGFEEFVFRYWKVAVGLFVVIAAVVLIQNRQQEQSAAALDQSWAELSPFLGFIESPGTAPDIDGLRGVAERLRGTQAGPWAAAILAPAYVRVGDYDAARTALEQFRAEHPDHPLAQAPVEDGGAALLAERLDALSAIKTERPEFFDNAAPPEGSPRVRLDTSAGPIELALYEGRAPGHVANFLTKVAEGTYVGTKFHRVMADFMIQGGDPNTVEGEVSTWGLGGGDETQPQEFSDLNHFPGYLSAAKRDGQVESGTHQFFITTGSPHHLDEVHTVFGKVVSGMDVVRQIEQGAIEPGTDRPTAPVSIEAATLLN